MGSTIMAGTGQAILVDEPDFDELSRHNWHVASDGYARRHACGVIAPMHRQLLRLTKGDGKIVDHKNGNKLDNRRSNLRLCTKAQNCVNRERPGLGVERLPSGNWRARLCSGSRRINLGVFPTFELAVEFRQLAKVMVYGEFAERAG